MVYLSNRLIYHKNETTVPLYSFYMIVGENEEWCKFWPQIDIAQFTRNTNHETSGELFPCTACGKVYKAQRSLWRHSKFECGKEPGFHCPHCTYKSKQKVVLLSHMHRKHFTVTNSALNLPVN